MNGIAQTYSEVIEVRKLDVNSREGNQAFTYYQLPGHPGFILLDPQGRVLWKGFGEQAGQQVEAEVKSALEAP